MIQNVSISRVENGYIVNLSADNQTKTFVFNTFMDVAAFLLEAALVVDTPTALKAFEAGNPSLAGRPASQMANCKSAEREYGRQQSNRL